MVRWKNCTGGRANLAHIELLQTGFSKVETNRTTIPIVLHIPHASTIVPVDVLNQFLISREELENEIRLLTDHATDRIFTSAYPKATACVFPVNRFVVDPERFADDSQEPMAETGMGVIYTHGTGQQPIRRALTHSERQILLDKYYRPHHDELTCTVQRHLEERDKCLVLDCHSFPAEALPYEQYPNARRPDFCLGMHRLRRPQSRFKRFRASPRQLRLKWGSPRRRRIWRLLRPILGRFPRKGPLCDPNLTLTCALPACALDPRKRPFRRSGEGRFFSRSRTSARIGSPATIRPTNEKRPAPKCRPGAGRWLGSKRRILEN